MWSKDVLKNPELGEMDSCVLWSKYWGFSPTMCKTSKITLLMQYPFFSVLIIYDQHLICCFHLCIHSCLNIQCLIVRSYWCHSLHWDTLGFWKMNADLFVVTSVGASAFFLFFFSLLFVCLTEFCKKHMVLICNSGCPGSDCID